MVKEKDKMQNNNQNELNLTILKTFLKTTLVVVVLFCMILTCGICLFPKQMAKACEKISLDGGKFLCYENVYKKSNSTANLYDLVNVSIETKKYDKTVKYIKALEEKTDYAKYIQSLDERAKQNTNIKYYAFVGDTDGYLQSQKIYALCKSNSLEEAKNQAILDLDSSNKYSFSLESYVIFMSQSEKNKAKLCDLFDELKNGERVRAKIAMRESALETESVDRFENVLRIYTLLKIQKTKYIVFEVCNDQVNMQICQNKIKALQATYDNLIK